MLQPIEKDMMTKKSNTTATKVLHRDACLHLEQGAVTAEFLAHAHSHAAYVAGNGLSDWGEA